MKNLSRRLPIACSVLALSFLSGGKILAELSPGVKTSPETSYQLLAQGTSSSETTELTISPPLTAEQQKKIKAINDKYIPEIEAADKNYDASVKDIETLIGINPPNSEIITKRKKVIDNEMKLRNLAFERLMEIREVLTPEQKASFAASVRKSFDENDK